MLMPMENALTVLLTVQCVQDRNSARAASLADIPELEVIALLGVLNTVPVAVQVQSAKHVSIPMFSNLKMGKSIDRL